jgi:hypothetical protein
MKKTFEKNVFSYNMQFAAQAVTRRIGYGA